MSRFSSRLNAGLLAAATATLIVGAGLASGSFSTALFADRGPGDVDPVASAIAENGPPIVADKAIAAQKIGGVPYILAPRVGEPGVLCLAIGRGFGCGDPDEMTREGAFIFETSSEGTRIDGFLPVGAAAISAKNAGQSNSSGGFVSLHVPKGVETVRIVDATNRLVKTLPVPAAE